MNPQDPLAQLMDIHPPEAVGWWPLAWGWWGLIALVVISLVAALWLWQRKRRRERYRRDALTLLDQAYRDYRQAVTGPEARRHYLQRVSELLRRTALSALPDAQQVDVAGLNGEQWLRFLDLSAPVDDAFTHGHGRALADGPYQPDPRVDVDQLHALAQRWLKHQRLNARRLPPLMAEVRHA